MSKSFEDFDLFIGPLPESEYKQVTNELNLFRQDRTVELAARALYGQKMAKIALAQSESKIEIYRVDQMTGLLRRDAFIEEVERKLKSLRPYHPRRANDADSALFIMLDIVDLHSINNLGGQEAGDRAIEEVADFIRAISRVEATDVAGRLGGDEFAILMPFAQDAISSEQMGDMIERRIVDVRKGINPGAVPAFRYRYATVGPTTYPPTPLDLLKEADPKRKNFEPMFSYPEPETQPTI